MKDGYYAFKVIKKMTLNIPDDRRVCILLSNYRQLTFLESVALFGGETFLPGCLHLFFF